jgi:hypothetical protein|tara:strand:+ start:4548 stop:4892 length:345 start_codon:yes stop_codon:yes gene_type:complete
MSLERAKINCERCYGLAEQLREENPLSANLKKKAMSNIYLNNDRLYNARNEALKALEHHHKVCLDNVKILNEKLENTNHTICYDASEKCYDCNYENPKIADIINDEVNISSGRK